MRQFATIEKLDTGMLYLLELASSLSVLLLAFGLIASMANVLTKGSVLTDNIFMQHLWAWIGFVPDETARISSSDSVQPLGIPTKEKRVLLYTPIYVAYKD